MKIAQNYLNKPNIKPSTVELGVGELVPNLADGTLWSKTPAGTVLKVGGSEGITSFLGLTDTPSSFLGQGTATVKVNVGESGLEFVFDAAGEHSWAEANPSGLIDGGELNIVGTDVEIVSGSAVIVDSYTNPDVAPVVSVISWNTMQIPIMAPANPGNRTRFTLAKGPNPGPIVGTMEGVLVEYDSSVSPTVYRDEVFLGYAIFDGTVWGEVSSPIVVNNTAMNWHEFLKTIMPSTTTISGGVTTESNVFSLSRASGTVWELNRNWHNNKKDPNREAFPENLNFTFKYMDSTQATSIATTVIDPSIYDLNGVLTVVTGNDATIQRVYKDQRDNYWVLYGQVLHNTWSTAVARFNADESATTVPAILADSELLGYVVAQGNSTTWVPSGAEFFEASKLSSSSGGGSAIDTIIGLLDTPNTYIGNTGKMLIVNAAEDAMEFITPTGGTPIDQFTGLLDTPSSYTGQANMNVVVNATEDGLSFVTPTAGGIVSVVGGTDITVDATDPANPIVNWTGTHPVSGQVNSVVAGTNCTVDATDPVNPIVNVTDMTYDDTAIQAEVDLNTAKVGITIAQSDAIVANTAKVGITQVQADAIVANTAKVGVTNEVKSDTTEAGTVQILNMVSLTQADYDLLTPVATTFYVIVG